MNEADRPLIGAGKRASASLVRRPAESPEWRCMPESEKQRARDACFRITQPTEQSRSADGEP